MVTRSQVPEEEGEWHLVQNKEKKKKNVEKDEVVAALAGALGRPDLDGHCRLHTRFGGVRTAVVRLAEA